MHSALYRGWVRHRRKAPTGHAFRYRLFMLYLDLAELPGGVRRRAAVVGAAACAGLVPAQGLPRPRPAAAGRGRAGTGRGRDRRPARWPGPHAHAPALLRLLHEPGDASTTASTGTAGSCATSSPRSTTRPGTSAMPTCSTSPSHGGTVAPITGASASPSTSRPSCRWTWTTNGDSTSRPLACTCTWRTSATGNACSMRRWTCSASRSAPGH